MDNFARCKEITSIMVNVIPDSEAFYGLYLPLTPPETWDRRWNNGRSSAFVHFWVEKDGRIIDLGKAQFGEPDINICAVGDPRYVKVGKYAPDTDRLTKLVNNPKINWGATVSHPGGYKTTVVVWNEYKEYFDNLVKNAVRN